MRHRVNQAHQDRLEELARLEHQVPLEHPGRKEAMDELGQMPNIVHAHKGDPPRREDPEGAAVVAQMLPATQLAESEHK
jgi:hypothetical protein